MKILFLCGSLEPGSDGVGDYTRRLAGELIRNGQEAAIVALNDKNKVTISEGFQECEGTIIPVLRIPNATPSKLRFDTVAQYINAFNSEWISLQFVPYSFNSKGLPFWLPTFLEKLKGNHKWHIMFHELWLGIDIESSFKHRCIGKAQEFIIKQLINKIKPHLINTQNKLYQFFLQSHNINVEVLPICGNIPLTGVKKETREFTQFVLFGTIHPGAPFEDFIEDLKTIDSKFSKPLKFVFIGKNGDELTHYKTILESNTIHYEVLGVQSENVISQVLMDSAYGIATTPYFQTEKSGVYAAYREHQLNTISVSRNWTPTKGQYDIPGIIKYKKNDLNIIPIVVRVFDLSCMAKQFVNSISKI